MRLRLLLVCALVLSVVPFGTSAALAADVDPNEIFFPVQVTESLQYVDSYGDCRSGCSRGHLGVDIMSDQMTPAYAAESGTIFAFNDYCNDDGTYCSYYLLLRGDDGRMYFYVHLNDDTPGRPNGCDHRGGIENAYSPRLYEAWQDGNLEGLRVERGEHIAYVGSSGNAGCRVDHIHFEVWDGSDWDTHYSQNRNPYPIVRAAQDAGNVNGPTTTPAAPEVEPDAFERIAGEDRIATAIALSTDSFESADAVVIAPSDVFAEALVGAPLAAAMDAPVLLTWSAAGDDRGVLDERVADEITRLGATYAIVLGNTERLGASIEKELAAATDLTDDQIMRIGGDTVHAMSASVAKLVLASQGIDVSAADDDAAPAEESTEAAGTEEPTDPAAEPTEAGSETPTETPTESTTDSQAKSNTSDDELPPPLRARRAASDEEPHVSPFLAAGTHPKGLGWPDALVASVLGSRQLAPVLLTDFAELPDEVAAVLSLDGIDEVRITGGPVAISPDVQDAIEALDVPTRRLEGETRFDTALAVTAETLADGATLETVAVATGLNFPDALAAGPALAQGNRPLVLVHTSDAIAAVTDFFRTNADAVDLIQAIGGPVAITDANLRRTATSSAHSYE